MTPTNGPVAAEAAAPPGAIASLRWLDWRFLLPAAAGDRFEHMVVLGGNEAIDRALRELGWATQVSGSLDQIPSADAVIVLDAAFHQMSAAMAAAADGVTLYLEVDRRRLAGFATSPRRLSRRLRRAGITPIGWYWVVPGFENALRYVPLDHSGALRWYLHDVFRRSSLARVAASGALRALSSFDPRRVGSLVPSFSVALITSGQDDGSRVVMLPFAEGSHQPEVAIKIVRHGVYNDRTAGEHAALEAIRTRVGRQLQDSLPAPHALVTWKGVVVAVESGAPGPAMSARLSHSHSSPRQRIDDLERTADWITRFNQAVASPLVWSWSDKHRWIDGPLDRYRGSAPITAACDALLTDLGARAARLLGQSLPLVIQHNDLGPWNVHRSGDRLTVIDWETEAGRGDVVAARLGLPMADVVYFTTHWLFDVRRLRTGREQLEGFIDLFVRGRNDRYTRAARQALDRYADAMGIESAVAPLLVALTWIQRANDRLGRARGDRVNGDPDGALLRFRGYVDALGASRSVAPTRTAA